MTNPGWTDRPTTLPYRGQRIVYVIPGIHLMVTDRRLYGTVTEVKDGKVSIELDKKNYAKVTFRFSRQSDGKWKRFERSNAHLLFKETQ